MKASPIPPEDFDRVDDEITEFLADISFINREFGWEPKEGFERELLEGLSNRDPEILRKYADFFEIRTQLWLDTTSETAIATFIARQVKHRFISQKQPITRPEVQRLVELEWAALREKSFDPSQTELGQILGIRSNYVRILKSVLDGKNGDQLRTISQ